MLKLANELKTQLIVTDSGTINQWRRDRNQSLERIGNSGREALEDVLGDLATVLAESEAALARAGPDHCTIHPSAPLGH